jgi:hypothetical protein
MYNFATESPLTSMPARTAPRATPGQCAVRPRLAAGAVTFADSNRCARALRRRADTAAPRKQSQLSVPPCSAARAPRRTSSRLAASADRATATVSAATCRASPPRHRGGEDRRTPLVRAIASPVVAMLVAFRRRERRSELPRLAADAVRATAAGLCVSLSQQRHAAHRWPWSESRRAYEMNERARTSGARAGRVRCSTGSAGPVGGPAEGSGESPRRGCTPSRPQAKTVAVAV